LKRRKAEVKSLLIYFYPIFSLDISGTIFPFGKFKGLIFGSMENRKKILRCYELYGVSMLSLCAGM
jgi:hypothetical protein